MNTNRLLFCIEQIDELENEMSIREVQVIDHIILNDIDLKDCQTVYNVFELRKAEVDRMNKLIALLIEVEQIKHNEQD